MKKILPVFFVSTFLCVFVTSINAQGSFKFSCTADTTIDCSHSCVDLKGLIPDVHALSSDYTVNPVVSSDGSVGCFPSSEPLLSTGPSTNLVRDDRYTPVIPLPFTFPFYGIPWNDIVISTNGEISFDVTLGDQFSNWVINGNLPNVNYDRAVIMGPFHDINIEENTSPLRQVKYNITGQAPCRKLVLTFYKIPCFDCTNLINNSYQITLYESLGIVEVFVAERQVCNTWNPTTGPGRAIIGMQNYARNKGIMAPGRTATGPAWGGLNMNETWRFTPKNGPSLFKKVELLQLDGTVVATGDTSRGVNNNLAVTFRGICPAATTKYIVRSTYYHYEYFQAPAFWAAPPGLTLADSLVYGTDTVTIFKNGSIPAITFRKKDAKCGTNPNGAIIVTNPPQGTGYEYSIDGGNTYQASDSFSVPPGTYTLVIHDLSGSCRKDTTVTIITEQTTLTGSATSTNTSCPAVSDGTITVTGNLGTSPYQYALDGGTAPSYSTVNYFTGLSAGEHKISIKDAAGCIYSFLDTVLSDPAFTTTATSVNATCLGALNGSITVTAPASGALPFHYSIPGGVYNTPQLTTSFSSLAGDSTYTIVVTDNKGCSDTFTRAVGYDPGFTATAVPHSSSCSGVNNGYIVLPLPTTGTAPYFYKVDTGSAPFPFVNIDTIRNLASGLYNVTIKDDAGCLYNITAVSVSSGTGVSAHGMAEKTACSAASTGKIDLSIDLFTGTAPFYYSLNSGPFQAFASGSLDTIKNLAANTYSVTIKDDAGCTYIIPPITVSANDPGVAATFTTKPVACATATNGQVFIKPTTGVSPFSYNLDNAGLVLLTDTIRNLDSGFHRIVVQDNLGCNITLNPEITIGPGVAATFTTKQVACATATNGQVFITPTTGVSPFSYNLDNTGLTLLTDTIRNLDSGFHSIVVQDVLGCNTTINPEITIGPGVSATFITKPTACATATTGQVFITPGTGVGPFKYNLDNTGLVPLTDTIRNLDSGFHSILVQDNLGCTATINPEVTIGPGVSATFITKPTACATATTGQIFITPTAGAGPFKYNLDNTGLVALTDTIRNLDSGFHSILVQDNLGCTATINPEVTIGPGVSATFITKSTACATASTGQIFITPTAGIGPFKYNLDNNGLILLTDTLRNLDSGFHNIVIQDVLGCTASINPKVGIGVGVTATSRSINSACLGVSTGQIVVTPTTGTPPFKYTLGGPPSLLLDTIRNLASGNYTVVLTDAVGCSSNVPAAIGNNAGVTASFTPVPSACIGAATGAIIVKPLTGNGGFRYSIDGGATSQSDSVFRSLAANAYTIRITDAVGCIFNSTPQNVTNNPGVLTNPSTIQNASCESIPNGSITVNVTAGIAPFTYVITSPAAGTPQPGNQFTALSSGSYDIKITDSAGCTAPITSVVGSNPKVKIDSLSIVRPTCNSLQNGTIGVNVSLGVAPYAYAIDNLTYGSLKSFSSIGAGSHFIQIKDANNCSIDTTIIITEPALFTTAVVSTSKATCSGNPDGKITMTAAGGTTPYQYTLDATGGLGGYQSAASFDVVKGTYPVTAKDAMGCTAAATATVDSVFSMYLDLGNETTVCSGAGVVLTPTTNPETNIFSYSPKESLDKDNIQNPTASPTDTTTYTLTAQWGICTLTDKVKVNVLRKPVPNAGSDVVICFDTTTVLRASASNLSGTVNYVWGPAGLLDTKADTTVVTVRPKEEDTYFTVTVTDNYNCNFSVTDSVLVKMLPKVYAFAGNDTNAVLNTPHQLTATGAGIGGTYVWSYPAGVTLSDDRTAKPIATFIPVPEPGTYVNPDTNFYRLSVVATDAAGCSATDTIKINVFIGPTCYVPSAFSPNNDGLNDRFVPVPVGVNIEYFRVFNRYGEVVYETSRFRNGWDGTYKGKPQPVGAYVWIFKGKDQKGRDIVNKGTVTLIR